MSEDYQVSSHNRGSDAHLPPHDLNLEKSVIGALLIDPDALVKVVEFLRPNHFYRKAHQLIYGVIVELYEKREAADLVTVPALLRNKKQLDDVGGVTYLTELVNLVPTAANVETYARIIREHAVRRSLINAAGKIGTLAFEEEDLDELIDKSEQILFSVLEDKIHRDFVHIRDTLEVTFEKLDELSKHKGSLRGVPTGFPTLDKILFGLQKEALIILAARPAVGKSSFALNISQYAATAKGMGVAYFSLEMSRESLAERMISAQGDIDNWRISTGNLRPEDYENYTMAIGELADAAIHIDDTPGLSVLEMRTKARRLKMEHKVDLIVVDYLQLIRGRNIESRVQIVSEISLALKNLARELQVPVLALSQLSRAVEQRGGDKRPQLSDLRDSGSIEQDADIVMFLSRPDEENREHIELTIAKHRAGSTGIIDLHFKGDRTRFYEMAPSPSTEN